MEFKGRCFGVFNALFKSLNAASTLSLSTWRYRDKPQLIFQQLEGTARRFDNDN